MILGAEVLSQNLQEGPLNHQTLCWSHHWGPCCVLQSQIWIIKVISLFQKFSTPIVMLLWKSDLTDTQNQLFQNRNYKCIQGIQRVYALIPKSRLQTHSWIKQNNSVYENEINRDRISEEMSNWTKTSVSNLVNEIKDWVEGLERWLNG